MRTNKSTKKTPETELAMEKQLYNIFDFKQNMIMGANIYSIATTQLKIFSEILQKEHREQEKCATPMVNVGKIALSAKPDQTLSVMRQTIKESIDTYLANFKSITGATGFFSGEIVQTLLDGPHALEKFADDFAKTEDNIGAGLRKKQSELKYGLKDTEKRLAYETAHFNVFEITPDEDAAKGLADTPREKVKPMVFFLPPVLGSDVGALSVEMNLLKYCCNKGIPVYVADLKPIDATEAVQTMGMDEYTADMATITAQINQKHGKPVTVVGYCMGGLLSTNAILSGEIKNVDATFRIVAPGGGEGVFDELLAEVPPAYSGSQTAQKKLPSGNKVIDGLSLQRVISDVDETVLPASSQYFETMTRTFKNVQQGKTGISEKGAIIQYFLNGGPAGRPPNISVGLTDVSFNMAYSKVADDGSTAVTINGKKINVRKLTEYVRVVNFLGSKDNVVRITESVGPMHKFLAEEYQRGQIQDVICPVGHLAFATAPDKYLEHAIDTQTQLTYQYNLLDQLEKEVGPGFLSKNKIQPSAIISPQTLPEKTIDLLIASLEKLETQKTAERDSNIKYLKQQKVWNSLINELGKEFLADHGITCEMITGRMSLPPETDQMLSEALRKKGL